VLIGEEQLVPGDVIILKEADSVPADCQLIKTPNLAANVPLIAISTDNVDPGSLHRPSRYNMHSLIFVSIVLGIYTVIFETLYAIVKSQSLGVVRHQLVFVFSTTRFRCDYGRQ
jgi:hypothetical protein